MSVASRMTPGKSWQRRRRHVSVLAQMALRRERIVERLVELREGHGLTQEQTAHRIGVSIRQYQRWEAGHSTPQPKNLDRIASSYGMSISEFLDDAEVNVAHEQRISNLERRLAEIEERLSGNKDL